MNNIPLIIHIGTHKTGTSYLQANYFNKIKEINYLKYNHFFKNWTDIRNHNRCKAFLISNEILSGLPWKPHTKAKIKEENWINSFENSIYNLNKIFPHSYIVIFFRLPGDLLISMYKQYIQTGGTLNLDNFYGDKKFIEPFELSIKKRIEILDKYFGGNCFFLNYQKFKKIGNKYVDDFLKNEFNINAQNYNQITSYRNQSITGAKLEIMRETNRYYTRLPEKIQWLTRNMRCTPRDILQKHLSFWKPTDKTYITELKEKVNNEFKEDWMFFEKRQWEK